MFLPRNAAQWERIWKEPHHLEFRSHWLAYRRALLRLCCPWSLQLFHHRKECEVLPLELKAYPPAESPPELLDMRMTTDDQ